MRRGVKILGDSQVKKNRIARYLKKHLKGRSKLYDFGLIYLQNKKQLCKATWKLLVLKVILNYHLIKGLQ